MGELAEYLKERFTKNHSSDTKDIMARQRVKNAIIQSCEQHLSDSDDEFTFEVLPRELSYAVEVIAEEPLKSNYIISQISETLFVVKLRELEL